MCVDVLYREVLENATLNGRLENETIINWNDENLFILNKFNSILKYIQSFSPTTADHDMQNYIISTVTFPFHQIVVCIFYTIACDFW